MARVTTCMTCAGITVPISCIQLALCHSVEIDGGYAFKDASEPLGVAAVHLFDEWTLVSLWDRSVDKRRACNCSFIVRGHHTFDQVITLAEKHFPQIYKRLKPIVQGSWTDHRKPRDFKPSGIC
jgi:hypothetical protein